MKDPPGAATAVPPSVSIFLATSNLLSPVQSDTWML